MKRLILVLMMVLVCGTAWADVTAKIVGVEKDAQNGSIVIKTQYKIDGVEVESRYPVDAQGRYYWVTRYNIVNFAGMTKPQILQRVKKDLKAFGENLIQKKFYEINNDAFVSAGQDLVNATDSVASSNVLVDTNSDGQPDKVWTVKTDGTKIESDYVAP